MNKTNKNIKKEKPKSDYQTIKHNRKNYYLIENKVYSINKNKSLGELFGDYINEKVVKIIKNNIEVVENIKPEKKIKSKIDYQIVKHNRKNYYLIENKVYSINKNKSCGDVFGDYINEKVVEIKQDITLVEIKPVELKPKKIVKNKSIININDNININDTINILESKKNN